MHLNNADMNFELHLSELFYLLTVLENIRKSLVLLTTVAGSGWNISFS